MGTGPEQYISSMDRGTPSPTNLLTNQRETYIIVNLYKNQTDKILKVMASTIEVGVQECKSRAKVAIQILHA